MEENIIEGLKFSLAMTWFFGAFFSIGMCCEVAFPEKWKQYSLPIKILSLVGTILATYLGVFIVINILLLVMASFIYPIKWIMSL